jgi:competence ComEA-like helix-hairpin-helix protein
MLSHRCRAALRIACCSTQLQRDIQIMTLSFAHSAASRQLSHTRRWRVGHPLAALALALALVLALPVRAEMRGAAPTTNPRAAQETVNINTADAATLARVLDGIGEAKALSIVEYRKTNGEFADVYELANVKGVGERTVELNEDRIVLKD